MNYHGMDISDDSIKALCRKWHIRELALLGSVLRDDFGPNSDVDVLVTFDVAAGWSLWDLLDLREELEHLFGRPVDVVERPALRNPFRRHEILRTRQAVYAA